MSNKKATVMTILTNLGIVMLIVNMVFEAVQAIDGKNKEARADGVVTPEEDAQIAALTGEKIAGILTQGRILVANSRT